MYATCCKILDLNPGANQAEIKQAFRKKAKIYHPDLNHSPYANQEFIKIKKAFDYLVDYNPLKYSLYTNSYRPQSNRRSYHARAGSFDRESYRKWQDYMHHFRQSPKKDFDFKTTLFGKIIYYFFHALFIFIGIYILISPTLSVVSGGIEPARGAASTIFAVVGASAFGLMMIVMITLSGLSVNLFKKA
ncbi:MAG: DnaJ domain-containing protein [Bacteroidales bacterium]|nr:DnaJ domain-containing protein [Bacteroidales bacterium]